MKQHVRMDSCECINQENESTSVKRPKHRLAVKRSRIEKLYHGKMLPLQDKRLVERLVRARTAYNDVRNKIVLGSDDDISKTSEDYEKDIATRNSKVMKIVDLIDKGKLRPSSEGYDCCDCCLSCSKACLHGKSHNIHQQMTEYEPMVTASRSSTQIIKASIEKGINRGAEAVRFQVQRIRSNSCKCARKLSNALNEVPKSILKKVRSSENAEINPEVNNVEAVKTKSKKVYCSCKVSKIRSNISRQKLKRTTSKLSEGIHKSVTSIATVFRIKKDSIMLFKEKLKRKRTEKRDESRPGEFEYFIPDDYYVPDYYCVPDDYCIPQEYNLSNDYCVSKTCYQKLKNDYRRRKLHRRQKATKKDVQSAISFTINPKKKSQKSSSTNFIPNIEKRSSSRTQTENPNYCVCEPFTKISIPVGQSKAIQPIPHKMQVKEKYKPKSNDVNYKIRKPRKHAVRISSSFKFQIEFCKQKYPDLTNSEIISNIKKNHHRKGQVRFDTKQDKEMKVLPPKECAAGLCLPSIKCDVESCSKTRMIKSRLPSKLLKCNSVCLGNKSVASSTLSRKTSSKLRNVLSHKLYTPKQQNKSHIIFKQNPLEDYLNSGRKKAFGVSSSFNEIYNDKESSSTAIESDVKPYHLVKEDLSRNDHKIKYRNKHTTSHLKQAPNETENGHGLKRCFCTLKFQKKPIYRKCLVNCTDTAPSEYSTSLQIKSASATQTIDQPWTTSVAKLLPFQYEPCFCNPGETNSNMLDINRGYLYKPCSKKINTSYIWKKSTPSFISQTMTMSSTKKKQGHRSKFKEPTRNINPYEPRKKQKSKSLSKLPRQAVRVGSSFSFDIQFYKDRSQPEHENRVPKAAKIQDDNKYNPKHMTNKIKRGEQGIKIHKSRVRHKLSQTSRTRNSKPESFMRRCFCSLKLFKTTKTESKKNRVNFSPLQYDTRSWNILRNRSIMSEDMKNVCNPVKCGKKKYIHYNKYRTRNSKTRSSSKFQESLSNLGASKVKHEGDTKRESSFGLHEHNRIVNNKFNKQAVRIGSNFSFNVEFYKDKIPANRKTIEVGKENFGYKSEILATKKHKNFNSRLHAKGLRSEHKSFDTHLNKRNKGIHIGSRMKKCFCILKLHKSGNDARQPVKNKKDKGTETPKSKLGTLHSKIKNESKNKLNPQKIGLANSLPYNTLDYYKEIQRRERKRDKKSLREINIATDRGDTHSTMTSTGTRGRKKIKKHTYPKLNKQFKSYDQVRTKNEPTLRKPSRQAVRITSKFNFDIEFSKQRSTPDDDIPMVDKLYASTKKNGIAYYKPKNSNNDNKVNIFHHASQANKSENRIEKASNVKLLLRRCFCTLQQHSKQNKKINSDIPNPFECAEYMEKQESQKTKYSKKKTGTEKAHLETKLIMTPAIRSKSKKVQTYSPNHTLIKPQSKQKGQIESKIPHSFSSSAKQTARIGSRFNFDVEFSKNKVFHHPKILKVTDPNQTREYQVGYFRSEAFKLKRSPFDRNLFIYNIHEMAYNTPHKLKKYECEPGVCVPYQCDPIKCEKRIRKRLNKYRSVQSSTYFDNKSISTQGSKASMYAKTMQTNANRSKEKESKVSMQSKHNDLSRQALKIGSKFSFDMEFYKEQNQHNELKRKANGEPSVLMHDSRKKQARKYRHTGSSRRAHRRRHRGSQNYIHKTHKGTDAASFLKRCFCTLKLRKIRNENLRYRNATSQFVSSYTYNNIAHIVSDANTMTRKEKIKKMYSHPLQPFECVPFTCVPGECNPYECEKRLKRYKELGVGAKHHRTKSVYSNTNRFYRKTRNKRVQPRLSRRMKNKQRTTRSKQFTQLELEPNRQSIRIGSSFSFDIEFFKNHGNTDIEMMKRNKIDNILNNYPPRRNICKATKCPYKYKNKCLQDQRCNLRNSEMQAPFNMPKKQSSITDFPNNPKRCFCTLKLHKSKQDQSSNVRSESVGTHLPNNQDITYNISSRTAATATQEKFYQKPVYKLQKGECEPGVCVPNECDPYECLRRIKRRLRYSKLSGTDFPMTKSTFTYTKSSPGSRTKHAQANLRKYKRKSRPKTCTGGKINDKFYSESPSRQAVRIGSNISFNIEFYKDGPPIGDYINKSLKKICEAKEYIGENCQKIRPKFTKSHGTGSCIEKCQRHIESQKNINSETKATGMGTILKRCFCTLKLRRNTPESATKGTRTSNKVHIQQPISYSENRMTMTNKYKPHLEPYECAPNVCVPGECNPYECEKLIKNRLKQQREFSVGTDYPRTKSASNNTRIGTGRSKAIRTKSNIMGRAEKIRRRRRRRYSRPSKRQFENGDILANPNRQAVRIGSSFNFNVEFFKDNAIPVNYSQPTPNNSKRMPDIRCNEDTCKNYECKRQTKKTKCKQTEGYRQRYHSRASQIYDPARKSTGTGGVGPFLQRCFCTLNLRKKREQNLTKSVDHGTNPTLFNETHKIRTSSKSTITKHGQKLKPYECEPGICIPGDCDPYQCEKYIKRRYRQSKSVRFKSTTTDSIKKRITLGRYECEPHVCIPGQCDPYDCEKRIERRHLRESGRESVGINTINKYKNKTSSTINSKKYDKNVITNNLSVLKRCFCVLNLKTQRQSKLNKISAMQKKKQTNSVTTISGKKNHEKTQRSKSKGCSLSCRRGTNTPTTGNSFVPKYRKDTDDLPVKHNTNPNAVLKIEILKKHEINQTATNDHNMKTIMPYSKRKFSKHYSKTIVNKDNYHNCSSQCPPAASKLVENSFISQPLKFFSKICHNIEKQISKFDGIKDNILHSSQEEHCYSECNKDPSCSSYKSLGNNILSKLFSFCKKNSHKKVDQVPEAPKVLKSMMIMELDTQKMALRNMKKTVYENTGDQRIYPGPGRSQSMRATFCGKPRVRISKSERHPHLRSAQENTCECAHCSKMRTKYSAVNYKDADIPVDVTPIVEMLVNPKDMTIINKDEVSSVIIEGKGPRNVKTKPQLHGKQCQCCSCKKLKFRSNLQGIKAYKKAKATIPPIGTSRKGNGKKPGRNKKKNKRSILCFSICDPKQKPKKRIAKRRILFGFESKAEKEKRLKRKESEHQRKERKAQYRKEDLIREKKRKRADELALQYIKNTGSGPQLIAESVLDLTKLGISTIINTVRHTYRAARDPKDSYRQFKFAAKNPEKAMKQVNKKMQASDCCSTFRRVKRRVKSIDTVKSLIEGMEERPILNYMVHLADKDPKKRMKKVIPKKKTTGKEPIDFGCSLYMSSLRRRPYLAVYYACPWFYPHCMQLLTIARQFIDILLFLLAVVVWSPCILCMELSRALMCCTMCTG